MSSENLLIACPACGRRVSREAGACPDCAHPIAGRDLDYGGEEATGEQAKSLRDTSATDTRHTPPTVQLGNTVLHEQFAFDELRQSRTAVWGAVGMLVSLDVATIALLGFSGSVLAILIHVLLIVGLLRGKRWARIWMLIALGFSLTLFGWFSVSQDDWAGALLFLGLFGPVALLLTGTSTRKRLTLGFAIFGVTLIWVVASNLFTFDVHTLAVGDCYDYPRDAGGEIAVRNLPKAKCADWHDVEVFAVFDYPAVGDEYPGESLVIEVSLEMCLAPFETFVGTPYEQTALDFHVLYPTLQSWASNGDHTVVCGVHRPDGEKLFGSVEGRGDAFDPQRGFEATVPSPRGPL